MKGLQSEAFSDPPSFLPCPHSQVPGPQLSLKVPLSQCCCSLLCPSQPRPLINLLHFRRSFDVCFLEDVQTSTRCHPVKCYRDTPDRCCAGDRAHHPAAHGGHLGACPTKSASVASHWWLKIVHSGSVYTTEINTFYKSRPFFSPRARAAPCCLAHYRPQRCTS